MKVMEHAAIDDMLEHARAGLERVRPQELPGAVAVGAVVVDIRSFEQRLRGGPLPEALVIDRSVLEWRLDPTSPNRLPEATGPDIRYVLVCEEGYSSSLAAATLQKLGLTRATDLEGGFRAWAAWQSALKARREATAAPPTKRRFWHSELANPVVPENETA